MIDLVTGYKKLKILNREKMIRTHTHQDQQGKGFALLTYSPPYTYESDMIYGGHSTTRVGKQILDLSQHMASVLNNTQIIQICIMIGCKTRECSNKLSSQCKKDALAFTKQGTKAFLQAIEITANSNKGANIHNNLQRATCAQFQFQFQFQFQTQTSNPNARSQSIFNFKELTMSKHNRDSTTEVFGSKKQKADSDRLLINSQEDQDLSSPPDSTLNSASMDMDDDFELSDVPTRYRRRVFLMEEAAEMSPLELAQDFVQYGEVDLEECVKIKADKPFVLIAFTSEEGFWNSKEYTSSYASVEPTDELDSQNSFGHTYWRIFLNINKQTEQDLTIDEATAHKEKIKGVISALTGCPPQATNVNRQKSFAIIYLPDKESFAKILQHQYLVDAERKNMYVIVKKFSATNAEDVQKYIIKNLNIPKLSVQKFWDFLAHKHDISALMISFAHNRETNRKSSKTMFIMVQGKKEIRALEGIQKIKGQNVQIVPYDSRTNNN
jgi:hypothetical protein